MALTAESVERLFRKLEEVLGYDNAVTMMELLSSVDAHAAANAERLIDLRDVSSHPARPRAGAVGS